MTAERFGDYELTRYLAAGGMADLWLARNPRFGARELVVKRIQPRYLDHTRIVRMFLDEGRIAKALDHRHIVRVVDVGREGGHYYIAMEYIHGHDLISIVRRAQEAGARLPRAVAVGIAEQIAAGLDYAHNACDGDGQPLEVVHCDVSPGNVVVSFEGVAQIVDFGIARATIALREEDGVAGKYHYMAPEQVRGEAVDARADLWSLGVILYELTVGRRLFRGRPEVVMRAVVEGEIAPPRSLVAGYPERLERIVMRLLERDRERRTPSAAVLGAALRDYLIRVEGSGFGERDVAAWMRTLWAAPRDEEVVRRGLDDDDEADFEHAMPEAPDEGEPPPVDERASPRRPLLGTPAEIAGAAMMLLALLLLAAFFLVRH